MENASDALIMAAGVLIGVLILSLAVYLFAEFGSTSAQIGDQVAQQQIVQFNTKFTAYEGQPGLNIYDVITVLNYAQENNKNNQDNLADYGIEVYLNSIPRHNDSDDDKLQLITTDRNAGLPNYSCKITGYHQNGRVYKIEFNKRI